MTIDRLMRASDRDRDRAAGVLRDAYAAGRLNGDELGERSLAAYAARTRGELDDLIADLPPPPPDGLPSDLAAMRAVARDVSYRRRVWKTMTCVPILAVMVAERVFDNWPWMVAVAALLVLAGLAGSGGPRSH